ncbi:MAG: hypothetical protein MUF22_08400 [Chitinispirillaceae bacterium]|nr:hypothetical protein [Chitinispirillaceae bacterium]
MRTSNLVCQILLACACYSPLVAQEEEEETVSVSACSLFIKTTPVQPDSLDQAGVVEVLVTCIDKSGSPVKLQEVSMTSTAGTLSCVSSTFTEYTKQSGLSCLVTRSDGTVLAYVVSVPLNTKGRVTAAVSCGDYTVRASSTFVITRNVVKKWNPKKPR